MSCLDTFEMRRLTCTITFRDGVRVIAKASSRLAGAEVPVEYSGDVLRLGTLIETASLGFLEWYLRARAQNMGATFDSQTEGQYDGSLE
jgi:hypothetical protein